MGSMGRPNAALAVAEVERAAIDLRRRRGPVGSVRWRRAKVVTTCVGGRGTVDAAWELGGHGLVAPASAPASELRLPAAWLRSSCIETTPLLADLAHAWGSSRCLVVLRVGGGFLCVSIPSVRRSCW